MTEGSDWERRYRESIGAEDRRVAADELSSLDRGVGRRPVVRFNATLDLVQLLVLLAVGAGALLASGSAVLVVAGAMLAVGIAAALVSFAVAGATHLRDRRRSARIQISRRAVGRSAGEIAARRKILWISVAAVGVVVAVVAAVAAWGLKRTGEGALVGLLAVSAIAMRASWTFGERAQETLDERRARRDRSAGSDQAVLRALIAAFPADELEALRDGPSAARRAPSIERRFRDGSLLHLRFIEPGLEERRLQLMSAGTAWIDAIDRHAVTAEHTQRILEAVGRFSALT